MHFETMARQSVIFVSQKMLSMVFLSLASGIKIGLTCFGRQDLCRGILNQLLCNLTTTFCACYDNRFSDPLASIVIRRMYSMLNKVMGVGSDTLGDPFKFLQN